MPCVIRDAKQRLVAVFQWFLFDREEAFDKVAVVFSEDEGQTWSKLEPMRVEGLPTQMMRPVDPTVEPKSDPDVPNVRVAAPSN